MAELSMTVNFLKMINSENLSELPHIWMNSEVGLVMGSFPDAIKRYDFGAERFVTLLLNNDVSAETSGDSKKIISLLHKAERITEVYEIETVNSVYRVGSAKQAMIVGLEIIEELVPGTLAKLSKQKGRSKRPVSLSRDQLYEMPRPMSFSEKLKNGYWVATNNKRIESLGVVRKAAKLAGLEKTQFELKS